MTKGGPRLAPLRVAFILPHLDVGGVENNVLQLLRHLDRGRIEPLLYLLRPTGALRKDLPADVPCFDGAGRRAMLMPPRLARWIRSERPDVVMSGTNAANVMLAVAVRLLAARDRPKVILSEHTSAQEYFRVAKLPRIRRALVRRTYPFADRLCAPIEALAEEWAGLVAPDRRPDIAVLPNPVLDEDRISGILTNPPERARQRIVSAGRLVRDKGHDVLIAAFQRIAEAYPSATLTIFGSGPQSDALEAQIAASGLGHRVLLAGMTRHLPEEFARAGIAAFGSRREGFGNVIVEAMAMGTPVVATDCVGPRTILKDGALGKVVPADDVESMARALAESLAHTQPAATRQQAQDRAMEFTIGRAAAAFTDLVETLAGPRLP